MKRAGFTMIELIFVIVILGILAAVAIPKLAATRTDAQIAKMATNAAALVSDVGANYTSKGSMTAATTWADMTNVATETAAGTPTAITTVIGTSVLLTDGTNTCVTYSLTTDGNLTVSTPAAPAGNICPTIKNKILNLTKVHSFGGTGITQ